MTRSLRDRQRLNSVFECSTGILNVDVCGELSKVGSPFRIHFVRVPYCIGDLKRDPKLENYPYTRNPIDTLIDPFKEPLENYPYTRNPIDTLIDPFKEP